MTGVAGWIVALVVGIVLVAISPHVPEPGGVICRVVGWIAVAIGIVLLVLWLLALFGVVVA